jgi:hypothetical protein
MRKVTLSKQFRLAALGSLPVEPASRFTQGALNVGNMEEGR